MTSSLYLLKDIDFPRDYSAVVDFDNKQLQRLYFQSRRVYGFPTTYNYIRGETQSIRVEIPQIEVQKYSYFEFTNTTPDGKEKTYYAFIDDVRYLDPSTSQIIFTIDVWQTYLFDYEIKDSFIDREHQNRCTSDLKPIFNTEIENIEVGSDYEIIESRRINNGNAIQEGQLSTVVYWLEVIATEPIFNDENEEPIQVNSMDTGFFTRKSPIMTLPLYVYYVPFTEFPRRLVESYKYNSDTKNYDIPVYWIRVGDMYELCVDNPKVVAVRIEAYPPFRFTYKYNGSNEDIVITKSLFGPDILNPIYTDNGVVFNLTLLSDDFSEIGTLKNEYDYVIDKDIYRRIQNETKLRQYPYEFLTITNYRGEGLKIKPEYLQPGLFQGDEFKIRYKKSISFNHKAKIYVEDYLGDYWGNEHGLIDNTVNELPLVTDAYKEYIANSKATATTGLAVNTGLGVGGLALGTALLGAGGPLGSLAFLALGLGVTGLSGVKSELIKQSNLKETPLSERQAGNDLLFDLICRNLTYRLVRKRITSKYRYRLYDYFYRYGYKANRFGIPNLRSRYYFNYIKTINIDIVGEINNDVKEKLKEIYNTGTTIWHCRADNPDPELFMYDKENAEVNL